MEAARQRFLEKVEKTDACWLWKACKDRKGYGQFGFEKKIVASHRFSYCLHNACPFDSIKGYVIRHSCHTPGCVNPLHLSTGSVQDNTNDKVAAGRQAKGTSIGACKLSEDKVREIRAAGGSQVAIAEKFGISNQHVSDIKNRKKWAWLE